MFGLPRVDEFAARANPMMNSAVTQCLSWVQRNFVTAPLAVERMQTNGKKRPLPDHPLLAKIETPNQFYSGRLLWQATLLSYFLDGNAYWIKVRDRGGIPTGLWYAPHWAMEPRWAADGKTFIDYYEYQVNGTLYRVEVDDVVHFRFGLDPDNLRRGLSPLKSVLREVFTDDEAGLFAAALLKNSAIPGVVISPKTDTGVGLGISQEDARQVKESFVRNFGGSRRGEPMVLGFEGTVTTLGLSPSDLDFTALRRIPEERISGAFGIPAVLVGLGVGLDNATYSNVEQLKPLGFEQCLVPTWNALEDEINRQLLPDFTLATNERVNFDTSNVMALRENQNEVQERAGKAFQRGGMRLNEYRAVLGLPADPDGDYYVRSRNTLAVNPADALTAPAEPPTTTPVPPKGLTKSLPESPFSRQPTDLESAINLKATGDAMDSAGASLFNVLALIRTGLHDEAVGELSLMSLDEYPSLRLEIGTGGKKDIRERIKRAYVAGRTLVAAELEAQGGKGLRKDETTVDPEDAAYLDTLAEGTATKLVNEVQARAIAAATTALLTEVDDFAEYVTGLLDDLSDASTRSFAAEAVNGAIGRGRSREAQVRAEEWKRVEYSALLDRNTCKVCKAADGKTAEVEDDLPPTPNPNCGGGMKCRCVHVYVRV